MKKEFFGRFFRRTCIRILLVGMLCAAVLRAAEKAPQIGTWIVNQLHTSFDISYFWK